MENNIDYVKELIERDKPKMVYYEADGYSNGEPVWDMAYCPNCNRLFGLKGDFKFNFCLNCGQRLKWEEEENE